MAIYNENYVSEDGEMEGGQDDNNHVIVISDDEGIGFPISKANCFNIYESSISICMAGGPNQKEIQTENLYPADECVDNMPVSNDVEDTFANLPDADSDEALPINNCYVELERLGTKVYEHVQRSNHVEASAFINYEVDCEDMEDDDPSIQCGTDDECVQSSDEVKQLFYVYSIGKKKKERKC